MSVNESCIGIVRNWAEQNSGLPFTAKDIFKAHQDIEDIQGLYAAISQLFNKERVIARRKPAAGNGFEYIGVSHANPDAGWTTAPASSPASEPEPTLITSTLNLLGAAAKPDQEKKKENTPPVVAARAPLPPLPASSAPPAEAGRHDTVNHPKHYTSHPSGIEVIQITEHMGFCLGNAIKYIMRADHKGNAVEDLKKARWYIERELQKRGEA